MLSLIALITALIMYTFIINCTIRKGEDRHTVFYKYRARTFLVYCKEKDMLGI